MKDQYFDNYVGVPLPLCCHLHSQTKVGQHSEPYHHEREGYDILALSRMLETTSGREVLEFAKAFPFKDYYEWSLITTVDPAHPYDEYFAQLLVKENITATHH